MNENDKFDENEIIFDPSVILVPKGIDHVAAGTAKDCSDIQQIIITCNVKRVEAGAFCNCAPTTEVFLVENDDVVMEEGAFEGVLEENIHHLRVMSEEEIDKMLEDDDFVRSAAEALNGPNALNEIG